MALQLLLTHLQKLRDYSSLVFSAVKPVSTWSQTVETRLYHFCELRLALGVKNETTLVAINPGGKLYASDENQRDCQGMTLLCSNVIGLLSDRHSAIST